MARKRPVRATKEEAVTQLTWEQVLAWRLQQHHLKQRVTKDKMFDVINDICGLQAQVLSYTELMLHARVEGIEPGIVEQALWEERSLVKTWAIRGTLHLLPSDEYPVWQAAMSTYRHYLKGAWLRHFGFTEEELEQVLSAIGEALDGRMLMREELAEEVSTVLESEELGEKLLDSWGATLKPASFRGHLCYAPDNEDRNVRFTRPDWWLPDWREEDPEQAMREVTRRYLSAYGPATRENFGRWWGLSPAQAMRRIYSLDDEVVVVEVGQTPAWVLSKHIEEIEDAAPSRTVSLLPGFDPYVLGAPRDEPNILLSDYKDRVRRPQGWVSPVLLVDGRMEGVWEHDQKTDYVKVKIEPFKEQPKWVRGAAEAEAERLAKFLGAELELSWQT